MIVLSYAMVLIVQKKPHIHFFLINQVNVSSTDLKGFHAMKKSSKMSTGMLNQISVSVTWEKFKLGVGKVQAGR